MESIEVTMRFEGKPEFNGVRMHLTAMGWEVEQIPDDKTLTVTHDGQGKANKLIDLAHDLHSYYS